jgi:hypothetical protein
MKWARELRLGRRGSALEWDGTAARMELAFPVVAVILAIVWRIAAQRRNAARFDGSAGHRRWGHLGVQFASKFGYRVVPSVAEKKRNGEKTGS